MSQAVVTPAKKAPKPRKPASHPPFVDMVAESIKDLADKRGSSRVAIKKHLLAYFQLEDTPANNKRINLALKRGVESGKLTTNRYHAGLFKIVKVGKEVKADKSSKATPKKVAAKTEKAPTKKVAKTPTKTPTKMAAKKVAKTPTKKAAKPKAAAKKPAVKKTPKKVAKKTGKKATPKK